VIFTTSVYHREWIVAYTSDADGPGGAAECRERFREKYQGCVVDSGWKTEEVTGWPATLWLFVPILVGEFVHRSDASGWVQSLRSTHSKEPYEIVAQGSPEEQALKDYGRKKLPV
jgi:hypothetical protein